MVESNGSNQSFNTRFFSKGLLRKTQYVLNVVRHRIETPKTTTTEIDCIITVRLEHQVFLPTASHRNLIKSTVTSWNLEEGVLLSVERIQHQPGTSRIFATLEHVSVVFLYSFILRIRKHLAEFSSDLDFWECQHRGQGRRDSYHKTTYTAVGHTKQTTPVSFQWRPLRPLPWG